MSVSQPARSNRRGFQRNATAAPMTPPRPSDDRDGQGDGLEAVADPGQGLAGGEQPEVGDHAT